MKLLDVRFKFDTGRNGIETTFLNMNLPKDIFKNVDYSKGIDIKPCTDENELCELAKAALSGLFYVANESELADRDKFLLSVNPIQIIKNDAGIIVEALIGFSLDEI